LLVFQKAALSYLLGGYSHQWGKSFLSKVAFLDAAPVAICGGFGVGAPALAIKLEELIAWGVKRFVAVGTSCLLTSSIPLHTMVVAQKAFGVDGVSKHYCDMKDGVEVDPQLYQLFTSYAMKEGVFPRPVNGMSSDLFFGATRNDVEEYQSKLAEVLDMETAALYAICKKRGAQALSFFVTSDRLSVDEWIPGFDSAETIDQLKQAAGIALRFCMECS
jgi:uridine phosphorylase